MVERKKGIGMSADEPQSLLVPVGFVVALLASIVALFAVATGALVVPARAELSAKVSLALVASGYVVPVLMLFATLIVRRSPRIGALAVLVSSAALIVVYGPRPWAIVVASVHVAGAVLAVIGGRSR